MNVLVLGGGIGGLETAIYLRKFGFEVTLVSERDYLYLYPTSIWIPTGEQKFEDVCFDLERFAKVHGFKVIVDSVLKIDTEHNRVHCKGHKLDYDTLVIALGASKMKIEGVEHAPSICGKPGEALLLKDQLEKLLFKGTGKIAMGFGGNPKDSSAVRGGPAFELIFNLHNYLVRKKIRDKFELNFFAPMPRPGQKMGDKAVDMMIKTFTEQKIGMHFGKKITKFSSEGVHFEDNKLLKSDYTMYIAAGTGHPVVVESGLPVSEAGFISIEDNCQVKGLDNVYAVGDIASITGVDWRAKQGHLAEAMGRTVAHNLKALRAGKEATHTYCHHMNIVCLMDNGKNAALVYRSKKHTFVLPLPLIGHFAKKAWGWYYKNSKLKRFPRIPGM